MRQVWTSCYVFNISLHFVSTKCSTISQLVISPNNAQVPLFEVAFLPSHCFSFSEIIMQQLFPQTRKYGRNEKRVRKRHCKAETVGRKDILKER